MNRNNHNGEQAYNTCCVLGVVLGAPQVLCHAHLEEEELGTGQLSICPKVGVGP